jgi:DNA ligase (NAD+)
MSESREPRPSENPYVKDPPTDFEPVAELSETAAAEQTELLREAIRYHDYRYYVEAAPIIADRTYDALFGRLQDLEAAFEVETQHSPTQRVGGEPVDAFDTVEHVAPMLSIDMGGDPEDVRDFDERVRSELGDGGFDPDDVQYVCEPKFDGVSIEVIYEDGVLERAVTRGDGNEGDEVTRNVRTVGAVPQRLRGDPPAFLAVRGELHMPLDDFQAYNRERIEAGEEPFANPRNATAGTIRQQDPSVVADRPLSIYFFDVLESSDPWEDHWDALEAFPGLGLRINDWVERVADIEDAIAYREELLAARDDLDYEIDGVVIKVDDLGAREQLGATSRHYRWAFAYKFPARTEETTVRDVLVQVGRTGRLTPVALLDPVDVGGVTVARASLHNPEQIAELGVDVDDRVRVERAGDVIPQVAKVVEHASEEHFEFPEACPVCGSPVERDGPVAFCTGGLACDAQLRRAIEHYASDSGLDIEGLGERTVNQLVDAGLIDGLADLYALDPEALADLEGWGERSATKLVGEINGTREPALADLLAALGIPDVGGTTAQEIAREFGTFEAIRGAAVEGDRAAFKRIPDVGPAVADSVVEFFRTDANREALDALLDDVDPQAVDSEPGGDELEGLTFVFTGALEGFTRDEAQDLVERHGANATSSVSGNTDYLVAGENPGATKREAAEENDVPVIEEVEFESLLAERDVL